MLLMSKRKTVDLFHVNIAKSANFVNLVAITPGQTVLYKFVQNEIINMIFIVFQD
jgi:hypothetical protein